MDSEATWLRLACNGDLENLTQQNQTQLKFQL